MANLIGSIGQILLIMQIVAFAGVGAVLVTEDAGDAGWRQQTRRSLGGPLLALAGLLTLLNVATRLFLETA